MTTAERAVLDSFKALVTQRLRLHQMILFGSRARGDADPESDMDVLVVLDEPADLALRKFVSDCAWRAGFDEGIVVAPVVFGRDEWHNGPERHSLFARAVRAEGLPVRTRAMCRTS